MAAKNRVYLRDIGDEKIVVSILRSFVPDTNAVDAVWTVVRNPGRSEIMAGWPMFWQRSNVDGLKGE